MEEAFATTTGAFRCGRRNQPGEGTFAADTTAGVGDRLEAQRGSGCQRPRSRFGMGVVQAHSLEAATNGNDLLLRRGLRDDHARDRRQGGATGELDAGDGYVTALEASSRAAAMETAVGHRSHPEAAANPGNVASGT